MARDSIERIIETAGGLTRHSTVRIAAFIEDYGCRGCWQRLNRHAGNNDKVCTLGSRMAIIHQDCCPVCNP